MRRGARLVDETKRAFPRPPRPPLATRRRWPSCGEIAEQPQIAALGILFVDERADRHGNLEIVRRLAGAVRPLAVLAAVVL